LKLLPLEFKPSITFGYYAGNIRLFNHCLVEQQVLAHQAIYLCIHSRIERQVLKTHADGRYWSL